MASSGAVPPSRTVPSRLLRVSASGCACALVLLALPVRGEDALKARLGRGEIITGQEAVEGSEVPAATLQAVVDAPPEQVWRIVSDCGGYQKSMPRIAASKELSREGDTVICEVTADLPFPLADLTAKTRAEHAVVPGKKWSRTWTLEEGDYHENRGSWTLTPFDEDPARTLVQYRVQAKPKVPIPQSLARSFQTRALPDVVKRLREATARPAGD